jgi:hypothetical protein
MHHFRRSLSTFGARRYQYCQVKVTDPKVYVDLTFGQVRCLPVSPTNRQNVLLRFTGVLVLAARQPSDSLLPLEMMRKAAAHKFAEDDPTFLQV